MAGRRDGAPEAATDDRAAVAPGALAGLFAAAALAAATGGEAGWTAFAAPLGDLAGLAGEFASSASGSLARPAVVTLDYDPSYQTLHVGVFSTLTVALSVVGYWILATRQTRGARLFAATLVLAALRTGVDVAQVVLGDVWTVHRALVILAPLLELFAVLTFLRFAGRYADSPRFSGDRARTAMIAIGALGTVAVLSNPLHGLVADADRATSPFVYLDVAQGPIGLALTVLTVAILLAGAGLLARSFTVAEQPDWWSAAMLTMGICLTVVVVVLDGLGQVPVAGFDYGGAALSGFLVLTTPALLGHGLRRIEITARESMLRELDDPIVIVDDKRRVVDFTEAARDLLPGDAAGRPFEEVLAVVPEWPPVGEITTTEVERTDIVREPGDDEVSRHYLMQTSPVTSETGDVIGYTVRFADVTDLKRRTAELARKNEQLDQFADTISSDLREPLRVASEYVDRLERAVESAGPGETLEAATVTEYLETIDRSLQRMQHIIDDLLALARDTDPVSDVASVEFSAVAGDAWALVDPGNARLRVDGDGTLQADRDCLQRVFENCYRIVREPDASGGHTSDRDAGDALGGGVQVAVGLTADGFFVTARGPDLSGQLDDLTRESGDPAAPSRQRLELSIVEHLVEAHGWALDVEPSDGAITFEVTGATTNPEEPVAGEA